MGFDVNQFRTICDLFIPTGVEGDLFGYLVELFKSDNLIISTDSMNNIIVHREGNGRKIVVATPADGLGYTIRYLEEDKAYLYADFIGSNDLAEMDVISRDGVQLKIAKDENGNMHVPHLKNESWVPGDCVQLDKKVQLTEKKKFVEGIALANAINIYSMYHLIHETSTSTDIDLYFVFTTQNQIKCYNDGGKMLAIKKIMPDLLIWFDSMNLDSEKIAYEVGNPNYIQSKQLVDFVVEEADAASIPLEKKVFLSPTDLSVLNAHLCRKVIGLYVPLRGEGPMQKIDKKSIIHLTQLANILLCSPKLEQLI